MENLLIVNVTNKIFIPLVTSEKNMGINLIMMRTKL